MSYGFSDAAKKALFGAVVSPMLFLVSRSAEVGEYATKIESSYAGENCVGRITADKIQKSAIKTAMNSEVNDPPVHRRPRRCAACC